MEFRAESGLGWMRRQYIVWLTRISIEVIERNAVKHVRSAHPVELDVAASPFSVYLHRRFRCFLRRLGAIFVSEKLPLEALRDKIRVSSAKVSKVPANKAC